MTTELVIGEGDHQRIIGVELRVTDPVTGREEEVVMAAANVRIEQRPLQPYEEESRQRGRESGWPWVDPRPPVRFSLTIHTRFGDANVNGSLPTRP